ncbi:50S ribosomal protein L11 methyltransferase [Rickettsiella grylli]|nr:50S ribosomal protein L11 methyltransferase [Rickettsiella grylli]
MKNIYHNNAMACLQLYLNTLSEHVDRVSHVLENRGAIAITWQPLVEENIYEPPLNTTPLWQQVKVSAIFAEETSLSEVLEHLHQTFDEDVILESRYERLNDKAWEQCWINDFKPMRFGKKLWICPSTSDPPLKNAVNVRLDPGLAFGTGTHPSTALCLEWLACEILEDKTMIDYGCGSGILAVAAIKLGAKQVSAIDHDPQAVTACAMNAERNEITDEKLKVYFPANFRYQEPVDIVIANILAQPLVDLAPYFRSLLKPNADCVLAGILNEQMDSVRKAYCANGFEIIKINSQQEWVSLVGRAL